MTTQPPINPEQAQQSELLAENRYGDRIRGLVEDSSHFNPNQLSRMMSEGLVKDLVTAADEGRFFTQKENKETGEIETTIFSVDDIINHQIEAALIGQDREPGNSRQWLANIPRSDGLRAALAVVMTDRRLAEPFRMAIYREQADLMKKRDEKEQGIITSIPEAISPKTEALREAAREDLSEEAFALTGPSDPARAAVEAARRTVAVDSQEVQKDPFDYLRTALPPVVRPPVPKSEKPDYDKLLFGTDEEQPWHPSQAPRFGQYEPETEESRQRKYYDKFVTESNRNDALETLVNISDSTPGIGEILRKHGISAASIEAVDAIREDPDVRFEVAKLIAQKLDRLAESPNDMGWRINGNSPNNLKVDPMTGKRMLSRTYAVSMALKMLGGEFSKASEGKDDFARDAEGNVAIGQHRHAATSTLFSY